MKEQTTQCPTEAVVHWRKVAAWGVETVFLWAPPSVQRCGARCAVTQLAGASGQEGSSPGEGSSSCSISWANFQGFQIYIPSSMETATGVLLPRDPVAPVWTRPRKGFQGSITGLTGETWSPTTTPSPSITTPSPPILTSASAQVRRFALARYLPLGTGPLSILLAPESPVTVVWR